MMRRTGRIRMGICSGGRGEVQLCCVGGGWYTGLGGVWWLGIFFDTKARRREGRIRKKGWMRPTFMWLIIVVTAFIGGGLFVSNIWQDKARTKGAMIGWQFRHIAMILEESAGLHGHYPPALDGKAVYRPICDVVSDLKILKTLGENRNGYIQYEGPVVDPFRGNSLFSGEKMSSANFVSRDMEKVFSGGWTFRGYPPRYYRNAAGDFFLLLSNGPDRDEDLTLEVLEVVTSPTVESFTRQLADFIYDATNGSNSNGDVFRSSW